MRNRPTYYNKELAELENYPIVYYNKENQRKLKSARTRWPSQYRLQALLAHVSMKCSVRGLTNDITTHERMSDRFKSRDDSHLSRGPTRYVPPRVAPPGCLAV